jgi:hypothetical protein
LQTVINSISGSYSHAAAISEEELGNIVDGYLNEEQ